MKRSKKTTRDLTDEVLPLSHDADFLRKAREQEDFDKVRDALKETILSHEDLNVLERKISTAACMLKEIGDLRESSGEAKRTIEQRALATLELEALLPIRKAIYVAFEGLFEVVRCGREIEASRALGLLIRELTAVISKIQTMSRDRFLVEQFRNDARGRQEFPSLISIFKKENPGRESFILNELALGADLPFFIGPKRPLKSDTLHGMEIVQWIDGERCYRWEKGPFRKSDSVYRRIVPNLDELDFNDRNIRKWELAVDFHLDFYQADEKTRRDTAFKWGLENEFEEMEEARNSGRNGGPRWKIFQEISKLECFKSAVKRKGKATLFATVKHQILEALREIAAKAVSPNHTIRENLRQI